MKFRICFLTCIWWPQKLVQDGSTKIGASTIHSFRVLRHYKSSILMKMNNHDIVGFKADPAHLCCSVLNLTFMAARCRWILSLFCSTTFTFFSSAVRRFSSSSDRWFGSSMSWTCSGRMLWAEESLGFKLALAVLVPRHLTDWQFYHPTHFQKCSDS